MPDNHIPTDAELAEIEARLLTIEREEVAKISMAVQAAMLRIKRATAYSSLLAEVRRLRAEVGGSKYDPVGQASMKAMERSAAEEGRDGPV
jgi:hypothetical protein